MFELCDLRTGIRIPLKGRAIELGPQLFPDAELEPRHARLRWRDEAWQLSALRGEVRHNGQALRGSTLLEVGDTLGLGAAHLRFEPDPQTPWFLPGASLDWGPPGVLRAGKAWDSGADVFLWRVLELPEGDGVAYNFPILAMLNVGERLFVVSEPWRLGSLPTLAPAAAVRLVQQSLRPFRELGSRAVGCAPDRVFWDTQNRTLRLLPAETRPWTGWDRCLDRRARRGPRSFREDTFAWGYLLLRLVWGSWQAELPSEEDVPAPLLGLLERWTGRDSSRRPRTVADALEALGAVFLDLRAYTSELGKPEQLKKPEKPKPQPAKKEAQVIGRRMVARERPEPTPVLTEATLADLELVEDLELVDDPEPLDDLELIEGLVEPEITCELPVPPPPPPPGRVPVPKTALFDAALPASVPFPAPSTSRPMPGSPPPQRARRSPRDLERLMRETDEGGAALFTGAGVQGELRAYAASKRDTSGKKSKQGRRATGRARGGAQRTQAGGPIEVEVYDELTRKTTVRYYTQMNPQKNFPLITIISKHKVKRLVMQNVAQVTSEKGFKVRKENPWVTVRPVFPGCLCVPAELRLDISPALAEAKFWLTPSAEGDIREARLEIWYEGRLLDTVPTPTVVAKQTRAKVAAGVAFFSPAFKSVLGAYNVDLQEGGGSAIKGLIEAVGGPEKFGWVLGFVALFLAMIFYAKARPKKGRPVVQMLDYDVQHEDDAAADLFLSKQKAHLLVLIDGQPRHFPVKWPVTSIGSAHGCQVQLSHGSIQPQHAEILFKDGRFFIRGEQVRVGGNPIAGETALGCVEVIKLGKLQLLFSQYGAGKDNQSVREQMRAYLVRGASRAEADIARELEAPGSLEEAGERLIGAGCISTALWVRAYKRHVSS